ncbi:MAG: hypothetical protein ACRELF_30260, partial [Gemmataceae bacterium]
MAISTSSQPFVVKFEQFDLKTQGEQAPLHVKTTPPNAPPGPVVLNRPPQQPRRRNGPQPVPNEADVKAAVKNVRATYNGDISQMNKALVDELNTGRKDPALLFALLRELRDRQAGVNVRAALSTAKDITRYFTANLAEMACPVLETATQAGRATSENLLELGLPILDQAIAEENYAVLARLVKTLRINAKKVRDAALGKKVEHLLKRAENINKEHDALAPQRKTLAEKPDDAKANLAVGVFHCAMRGDWLEGLPFLVRGGDAALKELAEKDLASPDDGQAQKALGAAWSRRATSVKLKPVQAAYQRRAYYWYQQAALTPPKGSKLAPEVR